MRIGKAWVVVEGETDESRILLSLIDSRKGCSFVRDYFRQLVVDRHASFEEKVAFKKSWKTSPFSVHTEMNFEGFLWSPVVPVMQCHWCHNLSLDGDWLSYSFKLPRKVGEYDIAFKEVTHRVEIDA